jgi:hypothetical protein
MEITGAHQKLQSAATTGNGLELTLNGQGREVTFYIYGTGTVSAGAVQCEECHEAGYTGTWAAVGSAQTVVSGAVTAVHATGCVGAVRARVSTNVTGAGGSVTVDVFVN